MRFNKDIKNDKTLTRAQKVLLIEMRKKFKPSVNAKDRCILFEVTKFKTKWPQESSDSFWSDRYSEFDVPDFVDALVRKDKLSAKD